MNLKYEYLLPIGSVVKVKNVEQWQMVIGVLQRGAAIPERTFDYVAVPYPEGLYDMRLNIGFDHNDIEKVIFRGYEDNDRKAFLILLEAMSRKKEREKHAD
ncbi:MAG: DUF4176 domain-containing protein [Lachnospiraceae bacterium]|nr:DUF4176 domain-containing protein [Lachnospiraceae bacterium]